MLRSQNVPQPSSIPNVPQTQVEILDRQITELATQVSKFHDEREQLLAIIEREGLRAKLPGSIVSNIPSPVLGPSKPRRQDDKGIVEEDGLGSEITVSAVR